MLNTIKNIIKKLLYRYENITILKELGHIGLNSSIKAPLRIKGGRHVHIGNYVHILDGLRLEAISKWHDKNFTPSITIDDNTSIGQCCHFTCANKLLIGKGVSIFPQVLITDIEHEYLPDKSIRETDLEVGSVEIGDNTVIGMGARILGHRNIKIGKNVVIGTNAVVAHNIPDYAVVTGIPAKIIRYLK